MQKHKNVFEKHKRKSFYIFYLCFLFFIFYFLFFSAPSAYAVTLLPPCIATGSCTVDQMVGVIGRAAQFLLGIVGSVTLLIFIYGGFVWLTSGGNPDKIKKGKEIVIQTVIGLAIVFGAYAGVHFIMEALGAKIPTVTNTGGGGESAVTEKTQKCDCGCTIDGVEQIIESVEGKLLENSANCETFCTNQGGTAWQLVNCKDIK
jgi:hypothetical protein